MGSNCDCDLEMLVRQVLLLNLVLFLIFHFGNKHETYQVSGMCIFPYSIPFNPHNSTMKWVILSPVCSKKTEVPLSYYWQVPELEFEFKSSKSKSVLHYCPTSSLAPKQKLLNNRPYHTFSAIGSLSLSFCQCNPSRYCCFSLQAVAVPGEDRRLLVGLCFEASPSTHPLLKTLLSVKYI